MKGVFCLLEKDDKTYNYVKEYYKVVKTGNSPMKVDAGIQKIEIERRLCLECIDPEDCTAVYRWIRENSPGIRSYLNSLKMLAFSIYFMNLRGSGFSFKLFCRAVNIWNGRKEKVVDSIFI